MSAQPVNAVNLTEVRQLHDKVAQAQQQLLIAIKNNQDVSQVVPIMQRAKREADKRRLKKANRFLDKAPAMLRELNSPKDQPL
ncbi:MAG: hypothetical protein KUG79_10120 [Pseudomonadales bacterium]|nr:hypothetical protein [Pseudomonadales bacterium]